MRAGKESGCEQGKKKFQISARSDGSCWFSRAGEAVSGAGACGVWGAGSGSRSALLRLGCLNLVLGLAGSC